MTGWLERLLTATLRHPASRAAKDAWRDLRWRLRRPVLRAGEVPAPPATLLFVCKGNICRSPFAAEYAARRLRERGVTDVLCRSAGYAPSQAPASPPHAIAAARAYGVDLSAHRPFDVAAADGAAIVVVMEAAHLDILAARGIPRERLLLLPRFAPARVGGTGYRRDNIEDPFGRPLSAFERCYAHTASAVDALVEALHDAAHGSASRRTIDVGSAADRRPAPIGEA
jgi:protein-tyrosine phosphatase